MNFCGARSSKNIAPTPRPRKYWSRKWRKRTGASTESEPLDQKLLALLLRYATTYQRTFHKSLEALKKLQRERLAQSKPPFVSQKAEQAAFFRMLDAATAPPPPIPENIADANAA